MKMSKTFKRIIFLAALSASSLAFAEKGPVYISPNNDGIQDYLEVPLIIKEKRYVSEWSFTILNSDGDIVRVIGNKEKRPDKITFKTFFKQLIKPKTGVAIPPSVIWNGYFEDGSLAPDGTYFYEFSATDDNGYTATTSRLKVIVDNTAPLVEIKSMADKDKIFGEGSKTNLHISQDGSVEDLWTGIFYGADGKKLRTFKWEESSPLAFDWNGEDDDGNPVADGVYSYSISSTDRAGNVSEKAVVNNIIYSAEKPQTNIVIAGSRYFSPNGDSIQDKLKLNVTIPLPSSKSNSITEWKVCIVGKEDKKVYRTYSGTSDPLSSIDFDGMDDKGKLIPEGQYFATVNARYLNGYVCAEVSSPVFIMDITVPSAVVQVSSAVFSPDGDGNQDLIIFNAQQTSSEPSYTGRKNWEGSIVDSSNNVVRQFEFGENLPSSLSWNGITEEGSLAPDGNYTFVLKSTEMAGNRGVFKSDSFLLDTSKTELALSASPSAFSPNGDGVQDSLLFTILVKSGSSVDSYELSIFEENSSDPVKTFSGSSALPKTIKWDGIGDDGTRAADGNYFALLKTKAKNGAEASASTLPFELDTLVPEISLEVPYTTFSPDGISNRLVIPVKATSSFETKWTGEIRDEKSSPVKSWTWTGKVSDFEWDGTDESGNIAPDGNYSLSVKTKDAAGNAAEAVIKNISLDSREVKIYLTTKEEGISPDGDGYLESQEFYVQASLTEGISAWNFTISDFAGNSVQEWNQEDSSSLPSVFTWNGICNDGKAAEGVFTGHLHVEYTKGNVADAVSSPFICSVIPPLLTVKTSPAYFSPDNDGNDDDLFILLKAKTSSAFKNWSFVINEPSGKEFWSTSGKSTITERIIWDGRGNGGELVQSATDYPYVFTVTDELGMTSSVEGKIRVDVLVIRTGNVLKMQVPSIIFRSDNADFGMEGQKDSGGRKITSGITEEQLKNNNRVLDRIADILKKFPDYSVTIEGHANRLTDNADEETVDNPRLWGPALGPLSEARAEFVRDQLIKKGISASRLQAVGKGGTQPVADNKDKAVNWKNRRVEFILEK